MSIERWREADGDNTFALDWDLDENSHVWEIGGFEGRWAQQIWDKFHCHITIFEPQLWAVEKLKKRFEGNPKITIHPYGLWVENIELPIGNYHTDGASIMKDDGREEKQLGQFKEFYGQILQYNHDIDLALMNIEGAEYTLIPAFILSRAIYGFKNIWLQFHPEEGDVKSDKIFKAMERSHELLWDFFPTAVAWTRR